MTGQLAFLQQRLKVIEDEEHACRTQAFKQKAETAFEAQRFRSQNLRSQDLEAFVKQ
jgi:hypothetical protein